MMETRAPESPRPSGLRMKAISMDSAGESSDARRRVEAYCQLLVDIGRAQWRTNESGDTELHMESGEIYLFGELGVTRLR